MKQQTIKPTAASTGIKAPWASPQEETEPLHDSQPSRGRYAVQHGNERRGRRSRRFPDLNIGETAKRLGITKSHLAKVLNGRSRPSINLAVRLSEVLGRELSFVASLYNNKIAAPKGAKSKR